MTRFLPIILSVGFPVNIVQINRPAQENPPPAKVQSDFVMWIGGETELLRLGQVTVDRVVFEVAEMSGHQRIFISVGTDIERIEITEVHEFFDGSFKGARSDGCE